MRLQSVRPKNAKQNRKNTKKNIWACGQKDQNEKSNMVYIKMGKRILKKTQKYKRKNAKQLLFS